MSRLAATPAAALRRVGQTVPGQSEDAAPAGGQERFRDANDFAAWRETLAGGPNRLGGSGYEQLCRLPLVWGYLADFREATGLSLDLAPVEPTSPCCSDGGQRTLFCRLIAGTPGGEAECRRTVDRLRKRAVAGRLLPTTRCFAGLTVVAVPVVVDGRHVATLVGGRVFLRRPTPDHRRQVVGRAVAWGFGGRQRELLESLGQIPVVTPDRFRAICSLLQIFADQIAGGAGSLLLVMGEGEPPAVLQAKRFFETHLDRRLREPDVAREVGLSPAYFCRVFKKATGVTFSEFAARLRVQRAKELLRDPFLHMRQVAQESGFGSIPQFNSVFRRQVGMCPTAYRRTMGRSLPARSTDGRAARRG